MYIRILWFQSRAWMVLDYGSILRWMFSKENISAVYVWFLTGFCLDLIIQSGYEELESHTSPLPKVPFRILGEVPQRWTCKRVLISTVNVLNVDLTHDCCSCLIVESATFCRLLCLSLEMALNIFREVNFREDFVIWIGAESICGEYVL